MSTTDDPSDEHEFRGGLILGRERNDPVDVVAYRPKWPKMFKQMRERLVAALGERALRIDHIGSTAIPGLAAKPVIDIQVSVPDVEDEQAYRGAIESCGFALRYREAGHRYFRPPPGLPRDYQVHVCTIGSPWERDHLLFRDFLRTHAEATRRYEQVKSDVAGHHRDDRVGYTDAKGPLIAELLATAEEWAREVAWQV